MEALEALEALAGWPLAAALRRSALAYAAVNAAHILGIALIVGAVATLDLRLLGAFRASRLAELGPPLQAVAAAGLALAVATGFVLFSLRPAAYAQNPAFLAKLALVAAGVANAAAVRRSGAWRRALGGARVAPGLRAAAVLSLAIWLAALFAGRWIGFLE